MDVTLLYVAGILMMCTGQIQAAKTCYTMIVSGAYYHDDVNGYYDVVQDMQCHGRDIYKQRDTKPGDDVMYIYYYRWSAVKRGWLIGTNPCSNDRSFADLYVWNMNQRPDRVLLSWIEFNNVNLFWYYNRYVNVYCTEGLTYPQIVGIVVGCLLGAALLAGLGIFMFHRYRSNKRDSRTPPPQDNTVSYSPPLQVTTHVVDVNNPGSYPNAPPHGQVQYQYAS